MKFNNNNLPYKNATSVLPQQAKIFVTRNSSTWNIRVIDDDHYNEMCEKIKGYKQKHKEGASDRKKRKKPKGEKATKKPKKEKAIEKPKLDLPAKNIVQEEEEHPPMEECDEDPLGEFGEAYTKEHIEGQIDMCWETLRERLDEQAAEIVNKLPSSSVPTDADGIPDRCLFERFHVLRRLQDFVSAITEGEIVS